MANFNTGNLLTAQTMVADQYAKPELRAKPAPAFTLLTGNSNFLIAEVESLKTRDDRAVEAHLFARTKRASGSARAYNHTGTIDDTQKVTLTWTTKSDKFTISLKLLNKSLFDFNQVLANKFAQACLNVLEDKETEAIAYVLANKTTAQPTLKNATFNGTNNAIEITGDTSKQFYQIMKSVMRQNYFPIPIDVIADSIQQVNVEFLGSQGGGNATNYGFQFQGLNIAESIELSDANYSSTGQSIAVAMPAGSVGALNWIPKENRNGWGDYNSYVGGYGVFQAFGYQFAVHGYALRADTSGTNGDTQDVQMEFEVSLDSSYNKAPLTTIGGRTNSVIHEFAQLP